MKFFYCFLISLSILPNKVEKDFPKNNIGQVNYELDTSWPQLSKGYRLSQPTGIGVDKDDHIFVFHRAGRKWVDPFPDSLISQNTVLELDNTSGKIINSWGA